MTNILWTQHWVLSSQRTAHSANHTIPSQGLHATGQDRLRLFVLTFATEAEPPRCWICVACKSCRDWARDCLALSARLRQLLLGVRNALLEDLFHVTLQLVLASDVA